MKSYSIGERIMGVVLVFGLRGFQRLGCFRRVLGLPIGRLIHGADTPDDACHHELVFRSPENLVRLASIRLRFFDVPEQAVSEGIAPCPGIARCGLGKGLADDELINAGLFSDAVFCEVDIATRLLVGDFSETRTLWTALGIAGLPALELRGMGRTFVAHFIRLLPFSHGRPPNVWRAHQSTLRWQRGWRSPS